VFNWFFGDFRGFNRPIQGEATIRWGAEMETLSSHYARFLGLSWNAAEAVLQTLSVEQRQGVRAVAADMLPAYANAVARQTPNAE